MKELFSVLILGAKSFPAWRIAQPSRAESNSLVKKRGSGVGDDAKVGVGAGVSVTGIGVGRGVSVGEDTGGEVGAIVAVWQAVMMRRYPIKRNFFIVLIKTQSYGTLFQGTVFTARSTINHSGFLSGNSSSR